MICSGEQQCKGSNYNPREFSKDNMNRSFLIRTLSAFISIQLFYAPAHAQVPSILNYQGRVAVSGTNFDGTGQFMFALVSSSGTATYWSNDGTSTAGSQPVNAVSLTVSKGFYSVLLGDVSIPNMTAIPASVFTNTKVELRVWFNDGTGHGWQQLAPDQRIAAVGYAMVSGSAAQAGTALLSNFATTSGSATQAGTALVSNSATTSGSTSDPRLSTALQTINSTSDSIQATSTNGTITISNPVVPLFHSYQMLYNMTNSPNTGLFTWVCTGDSVGIFKPEYIIPILQNKIGDGGGAFSDLAYVTGGSAVANANDWYSWVSGNTYSVPAGGTLTVGKDNSGIPINYFVNQLQVFFLTQPNGPGIDTFAIQTSENGGTWTTASATITTGTGTVLASGTQFDTYYAGGTVSAVATINEGTSANPWLLRVVGLSGTVKIIGASMINNTCPGVVSVAVTQGGSNLCSDQQCGAAILDPVMYALNPTVVSMEFKDSVLMWSASDVADGYAGLSLATWQSLWQNACPKADFIDIASTPVAVNNADQIGQNAMLQAADQTNGHFFFDGYTPIGNYANLAATFGTSGNDGIHPNPACNQFLATLLLEKTGWLNFLPTVTGAVNGSPNGGNYDNTFFRGSEGSGINSQWIFTFNSSGQGNIDLAPLDYQSGNGETLSIQNTISGWDIEKPDGSGGIIENSSGIFIGPSTTVGVNFNYGSMTLQQPGSSLTAPIVNVSGTLALSATSTIRSGTAQIAVRSNVSGTLALLSDFQGLSGTVSPATLAFGGVTSTATTPEQMAKDFLLDSNETRIIQWSEVALSGSANASNSIGTKGLDLYSGTGAAFEKAILATDLGEPSDQTGSNLNFAHLKIFASWNFNWVQGNGQSLYFQIGRAAGNPRPLQASDNAIGIEINKLGVGQLKMANGTALKTGTGSYQFTDSSSNFNVYIFTDEAGNAYWGAGQTSSLGGSRPTPIETASGAPTSNASSDNFEAAVVCSGTDTVGTNLEIRSVKLLVTP